MLTLVAIDSVDPLTSLLKADQEYLLTDHQINSPSRGTPQPLPALMRACVWEEAEGGRGSVNSDQSSTLT